MTIKILNIILELIAFILFSFVQSIIINGIKGTMEEGQIFEWYGKWVKKIGFWGKPIGSCTRCMAVTFGGSIYWSFVIYCIGFYNWEIPIFIANVFYVSCLSWYFYKKL